MKSNLVTTDIVIKGHNELTLKVGNKYEIHYTQGMERLIVIK